MPCGILSKKIVILILLFFTSAIVLAQQQKKAGPENKYRAVHWSFENGLVQGEVCHMIKDVNGFLWIGSPAGLIRFDGGLFKNYYYDPQKNGTLSGTDITGLIEDSLHNIWIGTENGLSRYDIKADTFSNFLSKDTHSFHGNIVPFAATLNEVYCCEKGSIISYNVYTLKKKTLANLSKSLFITEEAFFVFDATANSIWLLEGNKTEGGLLELSLFNSKTQKYKWQCFRKIPGHSHVSEGMCYDVKRYCLWINSNDGLLQFTLSDKKFHHIDVLDNLSNLKNYEQSDDRWHWVGIDMDNQNRIWIATVRKGIVMYDPSTQSVKTPFAGSDTTQKEISDFNMCIYCDREGIVWSGFWDRKGIYQLFPYVSMINSYTPDELKTKWLSSEHIMNVINGGNGKMYMGSNKGINIFDPTTNSFTFLNQKVLTGYEGKYLIPISIDPGSQKGFLQSTRGFENSIFEMNLVTYVCKKIPFEDVNGSNIVSVYVGSTSPFKGGCVITGFHDNKEGIFVVNSDSTIAKEILIFPDHSVNESYTTTDEDHLIFLRRQQVLGNLTYSYTKDKCTRLVTPLDSIEWKRIFYNKKNFTYWVTAYRQLLEYDKTFHLIRRYTPENGLPEIVIDGLIADRYNNIWFNTDRSLHRLNIATGEIAVLTAKEGFQTQDFRFAGTGAMDDKGNLYFPNGLQGKVFDQINPDKYTYTSASVYIRALYVNKNPVSLTEGINTPPQLSLRYFQNNITIQTGVIDYYSGGKGHIRYKLETEGANAGWQYAPAYYTITYEALPPGKYKLVMQASNTGYEFRGLEKTVLINISAAFWTTWWFRLIIIAIAAFFIVNIFQQRIKKIRHDAFIKSQLKELEMKALKAQMNPHFIYNALNSIQALVANDKKEEGIRYIGSFSRLLRQVLNNSESNTISLDKELETIGLYIQLEALRLNMQLQYKKNIPENIVTEFEKIPPLILQPFIENALWHGLSNKEGEKEIKISISIKDNWLLCDITDNGIGRIKAQQLKNNSAAFHQSKGIDITHKRLIDFNEDASLSPIEFFDLYNAQSISCGTRVIVRIKRKSG